MGRAETEQGTPTDSYRGFLGAYWFAFRRSRSLWFRAYVAVSALVVAFVTLLVVLAMIRWIARPAGLFGDRGLLAVLGLLLVLPVAAPVLIVARRHRRTGTTPGADRLLGLSGFAVVLGIYLGLVIAAPSESVRPGPFRPVVVVLSALPPATAAVPPLLGIALLALAVRWTGS